MALFLVLVMIVLILPHRYAVAGDNIDLSTLKQKIQMQKKKIEELNRELEQIEEEIRRLARQRGGVYLKLVQVKGNIENLENQEEKLASEVRKLDARLRRLEYEQYIYRKELEKQQRVLARRIYVWYKYSLFGWVSWLTGSHNILLFFRNSYILRRILAMDNLLLAEYRFKYQKLVDIQKEVEALRQQRQQKLAEIEAIRRQLEPQYNELSNLYAAVNQQYMNSLTEKNKLLRYKQKEEELLYQLMAQLSEYEEKGQFSGFIWPMYGTITSYFGWRIHPIYRTKIFHNGIDIAAPFGTPVKAAATGVVIYAGWFGGYGYAVVIAHPDGFYTLYAHLWKYVVKEGQKVYQGQVIGYEGSTGISTGPHLHFSIYKKDPNGTKHFVDPLKYLPKL
jgi:murein DD-endopeptidase MepM/ murein hydrolase activator NlpD